MIRRGFLLGLGLAALALPAGAEDAPDPRLAAAARDFTLAHVLTGDAAIDTTAGAGLEGLSRTLADRTTVEPGTPLALDLDRDDLSLLTLIYWPVTDSQPMPSPEAYLRLNRFLAAGGMILFDTRDGETEEPAALRRLTAPLDVPPLAPVTAEHVLARSFYLLTDFPGRWSDTVLWAEAPAGETGLGRANDGVSPVLIGSNDWAAAWAVDDQGYEEEGLLGGSPPVMESAPH